MNENPPKKSPTSVASDQQDLELEQQIRERAYELYEARGQEDGHEQEDWFQRIRKRLDQANEEPMTVHRRMPVIAAIERGRQFSRRCRICIAIQRVANVIWVLFVHASECQIREPLSRFDVELTRVLGGSTHREEQEYGVEGQLHQLIL